MSFEALETPLDTIFITICLDSLFKRTMFCSLISGINTPAQMAYGVFTIRSLFMVKKTFSRGEDIFPL